MARARPGAPYLESPRLPPLAKPGGATSERITRNERKQYDGVVLPALPSVHEGYFSPIETPSPSM